MKKSIITATATTAFRRDKWIVAILVGICFPLLLIRDVVWIAPEFPKSEDYIITAAVYSGNSTFVVDRHDTHWDNSQQQQQQQQHHHSEEGDIMIASNTTASVAAKGTANLDSNILLLLPKNKTTGCRFEDAKGYYNHNSVNGTLTYDWIHNTSSEDCILQNHLEAIRTGQYNNNDNQQQPLTFLAIGDSLDRHLVNTFIREVGGNNKGGLFRMIPYTTPLDPSTPPRNLRHDWRQTAPICSNGMFSFAQFAIFGMHHSCHGGGLFHELESRRPTNTSAERVETFLDGDIISRLPRNTNYVVMVGSCLWDLSDGCNNRLGVSEEYQTLYRQGIIDLHKAIQKTLPAGSPIYWRTCPYVSKDYDWKTTQSGFGRNRANQVILNDILRTTVTEYDLGVVVDWWEQANQRNESDRGISSDGRHYLSMPSLAFYNLFLNAVFDHHPELIQWQ